MLLAGGDSISHCIGRPIPAGFFLDPAVAWNEQQTTGKRLFNQNCALCHSPEPRNVKDPNDEGETIGPRLEGLFRPPRSRPEAVVKVFIQQGVEGKMPGFRYGLKPEEIDALIAYLKTL